MYLFFVCFMVCLFIYLCIYLFIYLLKAYSPVNRTWSPQGFLRELMVFIYLFLDWLIDCRHIAQSTAQGHLWAFGENWWYLCIYIYSFIEGLQASQQHRVASWLSERIDGIYLFIDLLIYWLIYLYVYLFIYWRPTAQSTAQGHLKAFWDH